MNDEEILAAAFGIIQRRASATPGMTVDELYALFSKARAGARVWDEIARRVQHLVAKYGKRPVMSLTPSDAAVYRIERRATKVPGGKGRTYKDLTINFDITWFKSMLLWGVAERLIPSNPWSGVKAVKTKKTRKTSPSEDEIMLLLAKASTVMRAFILLAADSGLRRDEARLLRWDWIDEVNRKAYLPADHTKSQRDRTVPVTARTFEALAALPRHITSPYVFVNLATEEAYDESSFHRWFWEVVDATGIKAAPGDGRVRYHDLRHAFARRSARAGVRIEVISMILGHSTLEQTRVYLQTGEDDIDDALDTFETGLSRGLERKPAKHAEKSVGVSRIFTPEKKST